MASGLLGVVKMNNRFTRQKECESYALEIAEAGINYYHWHLAHNPFDYTDGTGEGCSLDAPFTCGPYTHDYLDDAGEKIGSFEFTVTPPPAGSTIIVINATGWHDKFPNVKRTISTRFGIPSPEPYTDDDDANTTRLMPASLEASSTFSVPPMLTSLVVIGSSIERGTEGSAPWCRT